MLFLFTDEEIELINEVCGEWTEFVFQQELDVLFRILDCAKEIKMQEMMEYRYEI